VVTRVAICIALMLTLSATLSVQGWLGEGAAAESCEGSAHGAAGWIDTVLTCHSDGTTHTGSNVGTDGSVSDYTSYRWVPACGIAIGAVRTCGDWCPGDPPDDIPYEHQGLYKGAWEPLGEIRCDVHPPDVAPTVTPALVARAFQRIPLPSLRSVTQPANKTLINFDTIFYVDAQPLHRTLTLLGQRVELAITPSTFRWVHGDGTTGVTHTAGAAYPAKDVVYRYQHAHTTVRQHVEIVWTARWSLDGGPFQDVDGTVTTVGPETPLRVAEATPALSGYGH